MKGNYYLEQLVNMWDPYNLITWGAPRDEYRVYVKKIISLISKDDISVDSISQIIYDTFHDLDFPYSLNNRKCERISNTYLLFKKCVIFDIKALVKDLIYIWDPIGYSNDNFDYSEYDKIINDILHVTNKYKENFQKKCCDFLKETFRGIDYNSQCQFFCELIELMIIDGRVKFNNYNVNSLL